jgi:Putative Ig domain
MAGIRRSGSVLLSCAMIIALSALAGCKGGGGGSKDASASAIPSASVTHGNGAPTISGSAPSTAKPDAPYSFKPTASDPNGDTLSFQVQNKPAWATFNTVTGELSGIPTRAQGSAFANIVISASDGKNSASLAPFAITLDEGAQAPVATGVTLSWIAPTRRVDGSQLTDLDGYIISFGSSKDALSRSVTIDNPSVDRYVFDALTSGTYYFGIRAVAVGGVESELSELVSRVVE